MNNLSKQILILLFFGALHSLNGMGDIEKGNVKVNPIIQTTLKNNNKLMSKEFEKQCKDQQAIATQKYCPSCWSRRQDTWYWWVCEGCWEGIVTVCCYSWCLKNRKS